jgi:hypothetical protein
MATPGYMWIQGTDLRWTDHNGNVQTLTGTPQSYSVGTPGYLWVEGTVLKYIDSSRTLRQTYATYVGAAGTGAGYIWIENRTPASIGKINYAANYSGTNRIYYAS